MDQLALVDAITKHLDLLQSMSIWAVFLSLAIGWAGLQKKDITALGMTFARKQAFAGAVTIYLFANMIIIILFLRLGDLVLLIDEKTFPLAITRITTHTWIMNPYSYFGTSLTSSFYSCEGFGLLIVLWWACHASLATLIDGSETKMHKTLIFVFLALGLAAMGSVQRVGWIILMRGSEWLPRPLFHPMELSVIERSVATFLGITTGAILFGAVTRMKGNFAK